MSLEFLKKFFKKETRFGLKIGQKHKIDAMKWVSWCLISRSGQSFEILGHGDLSAADIKRISKEIGEDEMFIYGFFDKKPKKMTISSILMFLPLDEAGLQGIITKGKTYQVGGGMPGKEKYPLDRRQIEECLEGKRSKDQIEFLEMTGLTIEKARGKFWEFINS